MFYNAKNASVTIDNTTMDYLCFGTGLKVLIMIPRLGDGLKTVKGLAVPFALMYREYVRDYRVFVFSRKNELPETYTSREMARDLHAAMEKLEISKADVLGVSQGGTVAQYLAIDYPETVNRLVLAVTYAKQNETIQRVLRSWIEFAKVGDYSSLFIDTTEKTYSESYLKKNRKWYPLMTRVGKPKDFRRFLILAEACLTHNAYDELEKIECPTLVIGGCEDRIVTARASEEMAEKIKNGQLYLYEGLGHGAYDEAKDFNKMVMSFCGE